MAELIWLDGYSGQKVDALLALEGTHRIDSLVLAFEQAIDRKRARKGDRALTDEEWTVLAVVALEREVNNGGYDQFFVNACEFAPRIVEALRRIGCPKVAALTEKAIAALRLPKLTVAAIDKVLFEDDAKRSEVFDRCDERFFKYPENIAESLFKFLKTNKKNILL